MKILLPAFPLLLVLGSLQADEAAPLMHIDPLDENRANAMHRGPDPHAQLSPEQHMEVAAQHMAKSRLPQAMAVLTQALAKYPEDPRLFNMRASLELQQKDIK